MSPTDDFELDLHGLTVEDALYRLDLFLNRAFTRGSTQVRIVHGRGPGALRDAVRRALSKHPLVATFRNGAYGEGDFGVTVVELAR